MTSYRFIITGMVQGVYYRKNVQENASKQGFNGYVKNLSDGSVEAAVTCGEKDLEKFISILQNGSPASLVENISQSESSERYRNGFEIKY